MTDTNKEREAFEAWAAKVLGDNPMWRESGPCELAWQSWQARASLSAEAEPVAEVVPCHTPSGKRVALRSEAQTLPIGTKLYLAAPAQAPAPNYDYGPQSATVEEAARHVGKWLNERPNRPLDLRDVAMLVAHAQAPAPGWVSVPAEPTLDMGWAYLDAARESEPLKQHSFNHAGYRAMIAAAPSSGKGG